MVADSLENGRGYEIDPRPTDLEVIDVLDYYDGPLQFLARYVRFRTESGTSPVYGLVYGCISEITSVGSDEPRTYNLWKLPPGSKRDWTISEDELEYEDR